MKGSVELVLVDFDDTLVDTAPRFQNARRGLFALLESEGFDEDTVSRLHHEVVDPLMIERHGLGPRRLEHSFRETYAHVCELFGRGLAADVAERCAELGRGVAGTPAALDGAFDALRRLAAALPTAIYTQAGDREYQLACVRESLALEIVPEHRLMIRERKTVDAFREVLAHFGVNEPQTAWMIGNSMRSDINPALEAGARAILVETAEPWHFDVADPVHDDFVRVTSFVDAVNFLLETHA